MCYTNQLNILENIYINTSPQAHKGTLEHIRSPARGFPPDGFLTSGQTKCDVKLDPHVIAPDPFASDNCLDDLLPIHQLLLKPTEERDIMNPETDEPSSGLNARLRPRKSNVSTPQNTKSPRRSEARTSQDKVKRITPSKTPSNKPDDLTTKSDTTLLCPYCDRKFASKQTLSKHVRRMHGSSSKQDSFIVCLYCNHYEAEANNIVLHMVELHPQQYFACLKCHTRYPSSSELVEHKNKTCDLKLPYRNKLRQKVSSASSKETQSVLNLGSKDDFGKTSNVFSDGHGFNGIVISCEPSQVRDGADIEDNITTNLILPPNKSLGGNTVVEKNAVIMLDDINWNKRIPPNFSFHNTDADQILSRLGVVHRSPRTGESSKRDWKTIDDSTQKFEKCFDTSFYSKVASNVQENLSKFLDGSFNFNPDPDSTIKTRKSKNSVQINTAEGFPILLASEQYSRNAFDRYMPRAIAPKHKWKWDNLESEKSPINPDQIKRDSHTNNCIITLVSSLDIWTQLRMRSKFEEKFGCPPLEKKTEKQTIISNELKDILESRELPASSVQVAKVPSQSRVSSAVAEFPASLGLGPSTSRAAPAASVLSGEWVRPRCYVCCACGAQSGDSRLASTHASTHHPNAQVQHYEIVGEQLLSADIVKHLYVPPGQMCNRTRPLRGIRECTKCNKSITLEDLHQHMLDCAGDTPAVRRKCRYRPFGVRRRRPRLPDNTIRKKIRKDIRTRQTRTKKSLLRPRPIRTEVGDAETIRKMIADLPAKRHRVPINPNNTPLRPRNRHRSNLVIKGRSSEDYNMSKRSSAKDFATANRKSPMNDGMSTKSDDDKPLKPKGKSVASKTVRSTDSEKTSSIGLKERPKRKRVQVKEIEKNYCNKSANGANSTSKIVTTEELSLENSPQKVDINNVEFKAKEHVGRGSSSNRDGQRPGCSGQQNANSRNQCAPVENVPLKHSIARLTADSEKHDKSVQFHHLFLVQQECNNVNQHVHTGQELLFENEAAVLTLDKPPLHSSSIIPQDLQKNKLNKPRKGLNACIAMLKNKLVEPTTNSGAIPTGHVSVQCGDDEPLYFKPDTRLQSPPKLSHNIETIVLQDFVPVNSLMPAPLTRPRRTVNQEKKGSHNNPENVSKHQKPSTSFAPVIKQRRQGTVTTRESSRRRSLINDPKVVEVTRQFDSVPQKEPTEPASSPKKILPNEVLTAIQPSTIASSHREVTPSVVSVHNIASIETGNPPNNPSTYKDNPLNVTHKYNPPNVSSKLEYISPNTLSHKDKSIKSAPPHKDRSPNAPTIMENSPNRGLTPKDILTCVASNNKDNSPNASIHKNNPANVALTDKYISSNALTHKDQSLNVASTHKDNQPKVESAKPEQPSHEKGAKRIEKIKLSEKQQPISHKPISHKPYDLTLSETQSDGNSIRLPPISLNDVANQGQSNVHYGNNFTAPQQTSPSSNCDSITKVAEIYPDTNFRPLTVNIRPAHASTNIESMVAIPLDLSGKITNIINTQNVPNCVKAYVRNSYETYETLDLSSKNQDVEYRADAENIIMSNGIVDLSVKPSNSKSAIIEVTRKEDDPDLSLETVDNDFPTDLSIKKKEGTATKEGTVKTQNRETTLSYDESVSNRGRQIEPQIVYKSPTNLSVKDRISGAINLNLGADKLTDDKASKGKQVGVVHQPKSRNLVPILSEKSVEPVEKISKNLHAPDMRTAGLNDTPLPTSKEQEAVPKTSRDDKKNIENDSQLLDPRISDKTSIQVQKPIYDPTLKIPQYRIRATPTIDEPVSDSPINTSNSIDYTITPPTCDLIPNYNAVPEKEFSTTAAGRSAIGIKEQTHGYGSATPSNFPNPTTDNMSNVANCSLPAQSSQFECTTPVYTLANACISVTKIQTSNSLTIRNALLTPETTISNTTPHYTLAGTAMGVVAKHSHVTSPSDSQVNEHAEHSSMRDKLEESDIPSNTEHNKESSANQNMTNVANPLLNAEHDPETARKIALLPKELVEILGNMPVDHRNQLLNVLPQYVSTSTSGTCLQGDITKYSESSDKVATLQTIDQKAMALRPSVSIRESESQHKSPLVMPREENEQIRTLKLTPHSPMHVDESDKNKESSIPQVKITKEQPIVDLGMIRSDLAPRDSFALLTSNIATLCHKKSTDKVIDFTEEGIVSRIESQSEPPSELSSPLSLIAQPKQKPSNDRTASLRAVRIKAPSERKKSVDNQLLKQATPLISNKTNDQDNEVNKSLHVNVSLNTDITLAIQQAEVSSTQHSNKNVLPECKSASAISPIAQECNETNNCMSRRMSSVDVPKEDKYETKDDPSKCVARTTLVTSSYHNNTIPQECIGSDDKNSNSLSSEFPNSDYLTNVLASASSDFHKIDNSLTSESSLHTVLDTNKPCEVPTTPTIKPVVDNREDVNDSSPNTLEVEDSDDDLSLAVICQQKQRDKCKKDPTPKKKHANSIKKKPKKIKKKKENTGEDVATEKTSCNNNVVSPISLDKKDCLLKDSETTDGTSRNYTGIENKANIIDHSFLETRNKEKEILEASMDNETTGNNCCTGSINETNDIVEPLQKPLDRTNIDIKLKLPPGENIVLSKQSTGRQKKKKKRSFFIINSAPERTTEIDEDGMSEPFNHKTQEKSIDLQRNAKPETDHLEINPKILSCDSMHSNKATTDNLPINVVSLTPGSKTQDIENRNISLRRSRRGKSLSNSIEDENTLQQLEPLQENKTPLTKKQLIFSKLLLDEENNVNQPDGKTSVESKVDIISEIVLAENVSEEHIFIDESKSTKRKRSPLLKRKCKKKKSLDDIDILDESNEPTSRQTGFTQIEPRLSEQTSSHVSLVPSKLESSNLYDDTEISVIDKGVIVTLEKRKSGDGVMEEPPSSQPKKAKLDGTEICSDLKAPYISESKKQDAKALESHNSISQRHSIGCDGVSHHQTLPEKTCSKYELHIDIPNRKESKLDDSDARVKTCYNKPAAGRRTRSKSAVIKSAVYDPYDIDMDDMIESSEPQILRQFKTTSDQKTAITAKHLTSSRKLKELRTDIHSYVEDKLLSKESYSKNNLSDSDDSSKSDVPLKKYVEEKEKKMSKLDDSDSVHKIDVETSGDFVENKNKRTSVIQTSDGPIKDDTEEQLRSEQFMESFGFFSERKPRKSNLLATKKISETFHIIANECDDMYFGFKDKSSKKSMQNENRKSIDGENNLKSTRPRSPLSKKTVKRGRKKKTSTVTAPSYCHICKKEFRRPDNYLRHQMTLLHVSKLSEVEMKVKTIPIQEEPNYLLAYKEHLDRMKVITDKMTKRKKNSKSAPKVIPLTLEEILADVNKIVREQQLSQRGLSCDEELFLDCCELLKESHKKPDHGTEIQSTTQDNSDILCPSQTSNVGLDLLGQSDVDTKCDSKNDGDVDSITAKTILESEEVRNLENDLISGLKEAANASNLKTNIVFKHTLDEDSEHQKQNPFSSPAPRELSYRQEPLDNYEESEALNDSKTKKYPEFKEKMYPDIEEIDMFEDKFDKIKRKCRSQAAAAKQTPLVVEPSTSRKGRKKSEKKKGKKSLKINHASAVLTKGALKGFDGIKVSIPTSDINISAIVPPLENLHKKRKKGGSKKRREIKNSESSCKYDSDHQTMERSVSSKNVDVYEFMDNEDVELFEFRPSTLMERFKSISNKETTSTSRVNPVLDVENSSASASDGDDFVYMSDDYVCSDDETENSLTSCDVSNSKIVSDVKKLATQMKRRDVIEKNAVMGKIFKNNAVRSERKVAKSKEPVKPKANLDQLFDSLLEDEPTSSMLNDDTSLQLATDAVRLEAASPVQPDVRVSKYTEQFKQIEAAVSGKENYSIFKPKRLSIDTVHEISSSPNIVPPTCKITMKSLMGEHRSMKHRKRHSLSPHHSKSVSPNKYDTATTKQVHLSKSNENKTDYHESTSRMEIVSKNKESTSHQETPLLKMDDDVGASCDYSELCDQSVTSDETGVARQRARRKCTVGKQNILAESWSSESEPDGGPPRPRSAESTISAAPRKKKSKKKEIQHTGGRRGNTSRHISFKKQDVESRVTSSNRNTTTQTSGFSGPEENRNEGREAEPERAVFVPPAAPAPAPQPSTSADGAGGRFRTLFFWTAEGAAHEQQLRQQHGWIVGDSHKKLVTMLAQAKRRKRNNDDKRHLVE